MSRKKSKGKNSNKNSLTLRNSRKIYIPIYIMVLILLSVILWIYFSGKPLTYFSIALVILFSYFAIKSTEIHRLTNKYEIKSPTLIHTTGLFNKNERRVDLFAVSDADVLQNLWQRIWRYGDVRVRLFSAESTTIIRNINNPQQFASFLEGEMLKLRRGISKNDRDNA